jgi:hypothetical protein
MSKKAVPFELELAEVQQILKNEFAGACWRGTKGPTPITPDDEVYVSLASFTDHRIMCPASHLVDVVVSAADGEVRDDGTFIGPESAVTRVVPVNTRARTLCEGASIHSLDDPYLMHESDGRRIWLDHGLTELALHYSARGIAHELFPETPGDWMFLCVSGKFDPEELDGVFATYLYSLEESQNIGFVVERFPELSEEEYLELWPHDETIRGIGELPLGPLLSPRLKEVLGLYLEAAALGPPMFQILGYTRVVEYVSVVVNATLKRETDKVVAEIVDAHIRSRLADLVRSREAKDPSDHDLLAWAIGVVCDPVALAPVAPKCVGELRAVTPENVAERRARVLNQLSLVASATRNEIAHGKANYTRKGNECPVDQYDQFAALMRLVAQQAIHWLAVQPPELTAPFVLPKSANLSARS